MFPKAPARLATCFLFALVGFLGASEAVAQEWQRLHSSPALPPDHWAVEAARRAEALGLLPGYLPAQRAVPRSVVRAALGRAAERALVDAPAFAPLAAAWLTRFDQEFGDASARFPGTRLTSLGNAAEAAFVGHDGRASPGTGVFPETRTGVAELPAVSELQGSVSAAYGLGGVAAVEVEPVLRGSDVELGSGELVVGVPALALSVGRKPVGYGYGPGGLVLSGGATVDRVQLETLRPFRLPGPLAWIGDLAFNGFLGQLSEPRHPGDPYLWGLSGSVRPHPRLTLALHRASILGGDSVPTPLTFGNLVRTFVGHNLLGFENEIVSAEVRFRLPTEPLVPLTAYVEWGAEDAAGAWRDVPGRRFGLYLPAVPGIPVLALGGEYASFAESCCGNPPWYRHAPHTGNWVEADRPLGHELGGQGRQATLFGQLDLWRPGVRVDARLFVRDRSGENLYVPGREGSSRGVAMSARWRAIPRAELGLAGAYESGRGWDEQAISLGVRAFF